MSWHWLQDIGTGLFIVPILGLVESIAIGKAFGRYIKTFCIFSDDWHFVTISKPMILKL
jgi:hypothetical protein